MKLGLKDLFLQPNSNAILAKIGEQIAGGDQCLFRVFKLNFWLVFPRILAIDYLNQSWNTFKMNLNSWIASIVQKGILGWFLCGGSWTRFLVIRVYWSCSSKGPEIPRATYVAMTVLNSLFFIAFKKMNENFFSVFF